MACYHRFNRQLLKGAGSQPCWKLRSAKDLAERMQNDWQVLRELWQCSSEELSEQLHGYKQQVMRVNEQ